MQVSNLFLNLSIFLNILLATTDEVFLILQGQIKVVENLAEECCHIKTKEMFLLTFYIEIANSPGATNNLNEFLAKFCENFLKKLIG